MAEAQSKREARCTICGKPVAAQFRPFCSSRCRNVDLHRWLSEGYAIPAVEQDDEADAPPLAPSADDEH